jgi:hypothetical protein
MRMLTNSHAISSFIRIELKFKKKKEFWMTYLAWHGSPDVWHAPVGLVSAHGERPAADAAARFAYAG